MSHERVERPYSLQGKTPAEVAQGMVDYHSHVFQAMNQDHIEFMLKGKLSDNRPVPDAVQQTVDSYCNYKNIASFIINNMLSEEKAENRARQFEFWIDVLADCDRKHDHVAVKSILLALENCKAKLFCSYSMVNEDYQVKYSKLAKEFENESDMLKKDTAARSASDYPLLPFPNVYKAKYERYEVQRPEIKNEEQKLTEFAIKVAGLAAQKKDPYAEHHKNLESEFKQLATLSLEFENLKSLQRKYQSIYLLPEKDHQRLAGMNFSPVDPLSQRINNFPVANLNAVNTLEPKGANLYIMFLDKRIKASEGEAKRIYERARFAYLELVDHGDYKSIPRLHSDYIKIEINAMKQIEPRTKINKLLDKCQRHLNEIQHIPPDNHAEYGKQLGIFQAQLKEIQSSNPKEPKKSIIERLQAEITDLIAVRKQLQGLEPKAKTPEQNVKKSEEKCQNLKQQLSTAKKEDAAAKAQAKSPQKEMGQGKQRGPV